MSDVTSVPSSPSEDFKPKLRQALSNPTIPLLHLRVTKEESYLPAVYHRNSSGTNVEQRWSTITWTVHASNIKKVAKSFLGLGIASGTKIALFSSTSPDWTTVYVGSMCVGAVPVGGFSNGSEASMEYIITHSESRIVCIETKEQWRFVRNFLDKIDLVICMSSSLQIDDPQAMSWEKFLKRGENVDMLQLDTYIVSLSADQLATIAYTQATGFDSTKPKAVMFSHRNLIFAAQQVAKTLKINTDDNIFMVGQFGHITEQLFGIVLPALCKCTVYYHNFENLNESFSKVLSEMTPSVMFAPPFFWEYIYHYLFAKLNDGNPAIADHFKVELRKAFGLVRVTRAVSTHSAISPTVKDFFHVLGSPIYDLYGVSEMAGAVIMNSADWYRVDKLGKKLPAVDVKLAKDGELLVRGGNLFMRYYKDDELFCKVMDADGWLHTGDYATVDDEGFFTFLGSSGNQIVSPVDDSTTEVDILEAHIRSFPIVSDVCIVGEGQNYCSALIVLDADRVNTLSREKKAKSEDLRHAPQTREFIQQLLTKMDNGMGFTEPNIEEFVILNEPFSVSKGEVTPYRKLNRRVIQAEYKKDIQNMYLE